MLDRVLSADASDLRIGNARYALVCNESGGVIDDCIVFRTGEHRFFLVPNASNTEDVVDWLSRWGADGPETRLEDNTGATGMIVPACSPDAIVEAIRTLADDPSEREGFGCAAREMILRHADFETCQERVDRVVRGVVKTAGRR